MEPAVTILLADDEAILLLDYEHALVEAGYAVIAVSSGAKAIVALDETLIHGVITDVRFAAPPDGWEVGRAARRTDPEMPVIYVSGHGAADWPIEGVPNSIMLEKPFALAQLITAISQLLNARSMPHTP
ncbi:response regulator [Sinorhizobium medicae]|nr:response regulator [Sinorhizobium medicae]MDX0590158.1 response regulator [Sinorhizobium medicae]MDX0808594.1 response regulator [Sinorhizobium medicae]MDX2385073.1 response regulator [Sinorhizobium medicae]